MNPQGFSLLYMRRNRDDHRMPIRREDEEPVHFMVSNATYGLITEIEYRLRRWQALQQQPGTLQHDIARLLLQFRRALSTDRDDTYRH